MFFVVEHLQSISIKKKIECTILSLILFRIFTTDSNDIFLYLGSKCYLFQ